MNALQTRVHNARVRFVNAARLAGVNPFRSGVMARMNAHLSFRDTPAVKRRHMIQARKAFIVYKRALEVASASSSGREAPAAPPPPASLRRLYAPPHPVVRPPPRGTGLLLQRARLNALGRAAQRNAGFGTAARGRGDYDIVGAAKGALIDKALGLGTGGLLNRDRLNQVVHLEKLFFSVLLFF